MPHNNETPPAGEGLELRLLLDLARKVPVGSAVWQRARELLAEKLEIPAPIQSRTARPGAKKFLTIGMSTANDYDGVYFTLQSIRLYHPEILHDVEFLVVDNAPESPCGRSLKLFEHWEDDFRYIPYRSHRATTVRELVFREALGEFVLTVDCHVLFEPGSLARLIQYLRDHPACDDLLQGPLLDDRMEIMGTHFDPIWYGGMWGRWGVDARGTAPNSPPFEINMQGVGVMACRRAAWPGYNPRFAGFGCEEGYIQEKFRRAGGRALCLPFLRWLHRFERPFGTRYPLSWEGRVRNHLLAYEELGIEAAPMIEHYEGLIGKEPTANAVRLARQEIESPFHHFDAVFVINLDEDVERWKALQPRLEAFGISQLVRRFSAAHTPLDRRIGSVLSHRRIIAEASVQQLQHIIVFEDDNDFPADAIRQMTQSLDGLAARPWQIAFLDGPAIAYHCSVFEALLNSIPDDALAVARLVGDLPPHSGRTMQDLLRSFGVGSVSRSVAVPEQEHARTA